MKLQGIRQVLVICKGRENRYQTKAVAHYGKQTGMQIHFSPSRLDALNTGSADAVLREMEYRDVDRSALVLPADSLYEFSLTAMLADHQMHGSVATVMAMLKKPSEIAGKYGWMKADEDGKITAFVEKPTLHALQNACAGAEPTFDELYLWTNAGCYLLDPAQLHRLAGDPDLQRLRHKRLDFGLDLLPWLVHKEHSVHGFAARRVGDMGTVDDYLETMVSTLRNRFPSVTSLLGQPFDPAQNIWIAPETLQMTDKLTGKTLEQNIQAGLVQIGPNVWLGAEVRVSPEVKIIDSSVDDGVVLGEGAELRGSAVQKRSTIEAFATISNSYIGFDVDVASTKSLPARLTHRAIGDGRFIALQQTPSRTPTLSRQSEPTGGSVDRKESIDTHAVESERQTVKHRMAAAGRRERRTRTHDRPAVAPGDGPCGEETSKDRVGLPIGRDKLQHVNHLFVVDWQL